MNNKASPFHSFCSDIEIMDNWKTKFPNWKTENVRLTS